MRELVYYIAVSLDGYIAAPDGAYDAFPMEGDHMDAILSEYADTIPVHVAKTLGLEAAGDRFDTVLMGWNTYAVGLEQNVDDPYPHLRQYVFSRQIRQVPSGIRVQSDPSETVRALKAEKDGTAIWLCGGGALAGELIEEIDRLVLKVNPVVLGDGVRMIEGGYRPAEFKPVGRREFDSGVVIAEYMRQL